MDDAATQSEARGFRIVASLIVVLLAAGVCAGDFAHWSAASAALPKSMFSSGSLALAGDSVVMGARQLTPGQTVTGGVVLTNAGDAPGRFTLRTSSLVNTPGLAGGSLARTLRLTVTDVTVASAQRHLYEGSLAGLAGVDVGPLDPGAARAFRITVTFPRQAAGGTTFTGSGLSVAFDWTAVTTG
jgi:hypothetical protein